MFIEIISGENPNVISDIEFTTNPEVLLFVILILHKKLIELKKKSFTLGITLVDELTNSIQ